MFYMIGAVQVDTAPFSADQVSRSFSASWAEKPVIGTMPPSEFMGEGGESFTLTGKLLPYKIGGLSELDALKAYLSKGTVVPVMRGDGTRLGNFAILSIEETHNHIMGPGIGFVIGHSVKLRRQPGTTSGGLSTIEGLLSLFDSLF